MSELQPIELDLLEDLLEGLEDEMPAIEGLGDSAARRRVSERLADYRSILQASREALPLEEVPAGLLDGVLEQARTSTTAPHAGRRGLWERLRGTFVIPGLALATAAALVIVLVRPSDEAPDAAPALAAAEDPARAEPEPVGAKEGTREDTLADERLADASLEQRVEPAAQARGQGVLGPAPVPAEEAVEESEPARDAMVGGTKREKLAKPTASSASNAQSKATPRSAPAPRPVVSEPKALPKASAGGSSQDGSWPSLEQADAQRRAGNCKGARASYDAILKATSADADDRSLRARAYAGLGLCEALAGNEAAAEAHFAKARAVDPSVGKLIDVELGRASKR